MSVMTMGEYIATLPFCISRHGKAMEDIIGQWMYFRYASGLPYKTQKAVDMMARRLMKLSGGDTAKAREITMQSIGNNWCALFPIERKRVDDSQRYPKTLVTFRDCRACHNESVTVNNRFEEDQIRRYAKRHHILIATRKGDAR